MSQESVMANQDGKVLSNLELSLLGTNELSPWHGSSKNVHKHTHRHMHEHTDMCICTRTCTHAHTHENEEV